MNKVLFIVVANNLNPKVGHVIFKPLKHLVGEPVELGLKVLADGVAATRKCTTI